MALNSTENITIIQRLVALLHLCLVPTEDFDFSLFKGMSEADWDVLFHIAVQHDVTALMGDAVKMLPKELTPPRRIVLSLASETFKFEQQYEKNVQATAELLSFFNKAAIPTAILKGFTLAHYYPTPSHRKFNDLDIYQFGRQEEADALVSQSFNTSIDLDHSHHTKFCLKGVTVENHYDFINQHSQKSGERYELMLKRFSTEGMKTVSFDEAPSEVKPKYILLSPTWSAVFQLRHAAKHFATSKLNWRIVCDWMLFSQDAAIDWNYVNRVCKEFGMERFKEVFDEMAECVRKNEVPTDNKILLKILSDTCFRGSILDKRHKAKSKLGQRVRRFWDNRWKHRLAFSESWWSRIRRIRLN